jgi:hypothetical protein
MNPHSAKLYISGNAANVKKKSGNKTSKELTRYSSNRLKHVYHITKLLCSPVTALVNTENVNRYV